MLVHSRTYVNALGDAPEKGRLRLPASIPFPPAQARQSSPVQTIRSTLGIGDVARRVRLPDSIQFPPKSAAATTVDRIRSALTAAALGDLSSRPFDTRIQIPFGDAGTAATIKEMARQAVLGSRDPIVRLMAFEMMSGIPGRDHGDVAVRFFNYLQDRLGGGEKTGVKFINDAYRTEQVRAPWWTLLLEGGDCNSGFSTTLAALLMSVGIPCFFRTVAADPSRPESFSHVYTVAIIRGRELPLDASVQFSTPGSEPAQISRKKDWQIRVFDEDDQKRADGGPRTWIGTLLSRLAA